jgi:hypothetical protein
VEAVAKLVGSHRRYDCWRKEDLPLRWHYGTKSTHTADRLPDARGMGRGAAGHAREARAGRSGGRTASNPALKSMRAIFLARGPSLRHGVKLPPIENVDVYSLLMRLLGPEPREANDGNPRALAGAFAEPGPRP